MLWSLKNLQADSVRSLTWTYTFLRTSRYFEATNETASTVATSSQTELGKPLCRLCCGRCRSYMLIMSGI